MSLLVVGFTARPTGQVEGIAKMFSLIFPSTVSTVGTLYSIVIQHNGKILFRSFHFSRHNLGLHSQIKNSKHLVQHN